MNWLAHLQLSGSSPEVRIGNLLPDLLGYQELQGALAGFGKGIALHRKIDAFTDSHSTVRRSVGRIDGPLRRYGGILVDLFYDHFLASHWSDYCAQPLPALVAEFHESIERFRPLLPQLAYQRLAEIRDRGYLLSYGTTSGIAVALSRISSRLKRPVDLALGTHHLIQHYKAFDADFREFYPLLGAHIS